MGQRTILITGNSSGLGLGLTRVHLAAGDRVVGVSRSGCPLEHEALVDERLDLADLDAARPRLDALLADRPRFDVVYLNAGVLGAIRDLADTPVDELQRIMDINLWANKVVLDALRASGRPPCQVIAISSGAAVNGSRGWGAYALSKAALNMLMMLYAHELPDSHLVALAPGLVDTAMQDYLCGEVDAARFPSIQKLRDARGTPNMPGPDEAAASLVDLLPRLAAEFDSGSFVDVRRI